MSPGPARGVVMLVSGGIACLLAVLAFTGMLPRLWAAVGGAGFSEASSGMVGVILLVVGLSEMVAGVWFLVKP